MLYRIFSLVTKGLLLFLIGNISQVTLSAKHFNPDTLKRIAETEGQGYKTANLTLLTDEVCEDLNQQNHSYQFVVPEFVGISSAQVQDFLQRNGLDVVQRWQAIVQQHFPDKHASLNQVLKNQKFPYGFLDDVKKLEHDVIQAFDAVIHQASDQTKLDELFHLDEHQNQKLQHILQAQEKLMVRSTGKEDTEELANAGGNESVANVSPDAKSILSAMKRVVTSYFREKSLTQRLCAKDQSLDDAPFTPILIQRMVGEVDGQPLPRCGVMFTEEPEGALSKKRIHDESGTIKTSGITLIQAAFGHNEGVVNSIVPVDTYYIDAAKKIYPHIREKRFRIAPIAEGMLGRKNNTTDVAGQPALEPEAVRALKQLANKLEDFYQKPMDVEYVIMNRTLFIVQARPIIHNPNQETPSYLDLNDDFVKNSAKLPGKTISAGGGALRFIENKNQIIVKKNIRDALAVYQSSEINRSKIKAIVIGEMAPATSHEVTTFRSESKPVIACEKNFVTLETWVDQGDSKLIVDTQQQLLVQSSVQVFDDKSFVKEGWINYPLPQLLSVQLTANTRAYRLLTGRLFGDKTDQQIKEAQRTFMQTIRQNASAVLQDLILQLKTADQKNALLALKKIWLFATSVPVQPGYEQRIHAQLSTLAQALIALIHALKITQDDNNYLAQRLFPVHIIQTLLLQHHKDAEGLYGDSTIKIMTQLREEKRGARGLEPAAGTHAKLAGILSNYTFTQELKNSWTSFINRLDASADEQIKQQFYAMLVQLGKLDLLVLWLHTSFAESRVQNSRDLIQEFSEAQDFLNLMLERKQRIDDLNPASFDNPSGFLKCWKDFVDNTLNYFLTDFTDHFTAAPRLGKLAALKVMESLVTQFDTSIKAVTGSTNFVVTHLPERKTFNVVKNNRDLLNQQIASKKDKIFTFHIMLEKYAELLKSWYGKKEISELKDLKNLQEKTHSPDQLEAKNFDVNAVVLGNAGVDREILDTHEKFFMFCHQSLLMIIAEKMIVSGISSTNYPPQVLDMHRAISLLGIETGGLGKRRTDLVGLQLNNNLLLLTYNYPQRHHSARIQLTYDIKQKISSLKFSLFGVNTRDRWTYCRDAAQYQSACMNVPCTILPSQDVAILWTINSEHYQEQLESIKFLINQLCRLADDGTPFIKFKPKDIKTILKFYNERSQNMFIDSLMEEAYESGQLNNFKGFDQDAYRMQKIVNEIDDIKELDDNTEDLFPILQEGYDLLLERIDKNSKTYSDIVLIKKYCLDSKINIDDQTIQYLYSLEEDDVKKDLPKNFKKYFDQLLKSHRYIALSNIDKSALTAKNIIDLTRKATGVFGENNQEQEVFLKKLLEIITKNWSILGSDQDKQFIYQQLKGALKNQKIYAFKFLKSIQDKQVLSELFMNLRKPSFDFAIEKLKDDIEKKSTELNLIKYYNKALKFIKLFGNDETEKKSANDLIQKAYKFRQVALIKGKIEDSFKSPEPYNIQ